MKIIENRIAFRNYNVLTLVIFGVIILPCLALGYTIKEYYPLTQGNIWTYSVARDQEMSEENKKVKGAVLIGEVETLKVVTSDKDYSYMNIDSEGLKIYKNFHNDSYTVFDPAFVGVPNIEIGETKDYVTNASSYNISDEKLKETKIRGYRKLDSLADVEVPAGKFSGCLKIAFFSETGEKGVETMSRKIALFGLPLV